jgi:hypothetical protein
MFRSQSKSKSLKVQRETVRVLAGSQLAAAQGGGFGNQGPFVATEEVCPAPPQIDLPNNISHIVPGACGPQIPGRSVVVNPSYP